jgi:hypothetical protein
MFVIVRFQKFGIHDVSGICSHFFSQAICCHVTVKVSSIILKWTGPMFWLGYTTIQKVPSSIPAVAINIVMKNIQIFNRSLKTEVYKSSETLCISYTSESGVIYLRTCIYNYFK